MDAKILELEKALTKAKFILSQKAGALHDLIEDRLPDDYKDIPAYADSTFKACQEWDTIRQQLENAKNKLV
jgi:hypothetical protein